MAQRWLFRAVQRAVRKLRDWILRQCLIALRTNPFYVIWHCRHLTLQYRCSRRIFPITFNLETEDPWNKCTSLTDHRDLWGFHLCFSSFLLKMGFLNLSQELPEPFGVTSANGTQMPRREPTVSLRCNSDTKQLLKIIVAKWYCLHNSRLNQLLGKRLICLWALWSRGSSFLL